MKDPHYSEFPKHSHCTQSTPWRIAQHVLRFFFFILCFLRFSLTLFSIVCKTILGAGNYISLAHAIFCHLADDGFSVLNGSAITMAFVVAVIQQIHPIRSPMSRPLSPLPGARSSPQVRGERSHAGHRPAASPPRSAWPSAPNAEPQKAAQFGSNTLAFVCCCGFFFFGGGVHVTSTGRVSHSPMAVL